MSVRRARAVDLEHGVETGRAAGARDLEIDLRARGGVDQVAEPVRGRGHHAVDRRVGREEAGQLDAGDAVLLVLADDDVGVAAVIEVRGGAGGREQGGGGEPGSQAKHRGPARCSIDAARRHRRTRAMTRGSDAVRTGHRAVQAGVFAIDLS
jgi:hypothetical protein